MWPFTRKTLCERRGWHDWNEVGCSGVRVYPLDGSCCLSCPVIYKAPPRPPVPVTDRIDALRFFLGSYAEIHTRTLRYPTYGRIGTYSFFLTNTKSLDDTIRDLWDSL